MKFGFFVTTANLSSNLAVPDSLLNEWSNAKPGCIEDFKTVLSPFFSDTFIQKSETVTNHYYEYRAKGKNQQSPKAFYRQLAALRQFNGERFFSNINPSECTFVGGAKDYILGSKHNLDLKSLSPESTHIEISELGHMINIEKPELFNLQGSK
ncbi:MAG: alpha/beta fold hydrolase [Pseudobdellovibrionaceae bacterium]